MSNPIFETLHHLTADNLVSEKKDTKVVTLSTENSVEEAMKILSTNKILSAPLLDKDNTYLGFLDTADILSYVNTVAPDSFSLEVNEERSLATAGRAMSLMQLSQLAKMNLLAQEPTVMIYTSDPVTRLVDLFSKGFHRALLYGKDKSVQALVSQSDVIRHLANTVHRERMKDMAEMTIQDFGYGATQVEALNGNETVLKAIDTMTKNKVRALAIVDRESGRLIGNFSPSNLRAMYTEHFPSFLKPVNEYLEKYYPASLNPIVVRPDTKLGDVIREFSTSNVHHLWIVDDKFAPVGVLSMTDVMNIILNFKNM